MDRYIKVLSSNGAIIDAIINPVFAGWDSIESEIVFYEEDSSSVMGLISSNGTMIWQIHERAPFPEYLELITVSYEEISKEEYEVLKDTLSPDENKSGDDAPIDPVENIENVKRARINALSQQCETTIFNGIDVTLSDGITHHFSLSIEDQLNLITLSSMISSGYETIPYHADGAPCVFYSAEDMSLIIDTATDFKTFHTTYFNSLKTYVEAVDTVAELDTIYYGAAIPTQYQSDVLKKLLTAGEQNAVQGS